MSATKKVFVRVVSALYRCRWILNFSRFYLKPEVLALEVEKFSSQIFKGKARSKVLVISLKYDYGIPFRGIAYEYQNQTRCLMNMDEIWAIHFDYYSYCFKYGHKFAHKVLSELMFSQNFDAIFYIPYLHYLYNDDWTKLKKNHSIKLIAWLFDDDKRHEEHSRHLASADALVTTMPIVFNKRKEDGWENQILANFAVNETLYQDYNIPRDIDVLFIGQSFGIRQEFISYLALNGINVVKRGLGWPEGRVDMREMISLLNRAKIVLNFCDSDTRPELSHVKGRVFEVCATGGCLLTQESPDLVELFDLNDEVATFNSKEEMIQKVRFLLENPKVRQDIAAAGKNAVMSRYRLGTYLELCFRKVGV